MEQPVIETERLLLRPFDSEDAKDIQKLAGNRKVSEATRNIPYPYKDGIAEEWISNHVSCWKNRTGAIYAVTEKISKKLFGAVSLVEINGAAAKLGYWMGEPYWDKGYSTEAAKALLQFAFTGMGVKKVIAEHLSSNPASGRVMEKIGMLYVNQIQKLDRNGQMAQMEIYELRNT